MLINYSLFTNYNLVSFTTSVKGGVSRDNYSTFNLSKYSNDDINDVLENRRILAQKIGVSVDSLFVPFQTHEDKVKVIDSSFLLLSPKEREKELEGFDALITKEKNICIGITTADCVPILIYDPANHILDSAHAGWKGTVLRIGVKMVMKMQEQFGSKPSDLIVGIGPSISSDMFEVGDEVGDVFAKEGFNLDTISYRKPETGKLHIDLWQANREQLLSLGVKEENIEVSGICTFQDTNFFSARRQTINSGRMITGGVLK